MIRAIEVHKSQIISFKGGQGRLPWEINMSKDPEEVKELEMRASAGEGAGRGNWQGSRGPEKSLFVLGTPKRPVGMEWSEYGEEQWK